MQIGAGRLIAYVNGFFNKNGHLLSNSLHVLLSHKKKRSLLATSTVSFSYYPLFANMKRKQLQNINRTWLCISKSYLITKSNRLFRSAQAQSIRLPFLLQIDGSEQKVNGHRTYTNKSNERIAITNDRTVADCTISIRKGKRASELTMFYLLASICLRLI